MTDAAKKILEQFDALPEKEKRWLADAISDRLPRESEEEIGEAWRRELVRRLEQVERGDAEIIPAEEVQRRLRAIVGE